MVHKHNEIYTANPFTKTALAAKALYDGFISDSDKFKCFEVRNSAAQELASSGIVFEGVRLNDMLMRYRVRNFPESLSYSEQEQWYKYRVKVLTELWNESLTLDELHELIFSLL